ncbi:hypothetical protein [Bdellovibrio sp. NC01]|uniref:hypothetical protein n=1 Tax=Bdellovibrio sp. NC01 TaxID=2220073 RepID=UPI00115AADB2|nr:hypothetical protein [Bdellovibrio sp. NC01]QDK37132.1 hypothetical protein DOE51_05755 [Bdellovibrio sp. NC01]
MKIKVLTTALIFAIAWAIGATFMYLQLKNNPRVVAVTTAAPSALNQENLQLSELEKITFLRQYLERFFNFDSNNFWQTQTSLSFLMAPDLRNQRIEEVRRLREKIQQKNIVQKGELLTLSSNGKDKFTAQIHTETMEENGVKNQLNSFLSLELASTERTLENPWGLLVKQMKFEKTSSDPQSFSSSLSIKEKIPLTITLPCAIENIENPNERALKTKITTMNISEIQLTTPTPLLAPVTMKALCKETEFVFEVKQGKQDSDLFVAFPASVAVVRKKEIPTAPKRKKDIYDKTIESVLGIKLDD